MARRKSIFEGVKSYPKQALGKPTLAGPKLNLPKVSVSDYAAASPLTLQGTESPFVLKAPKPKKPRLPQSS